MSEDFKEVAHGISFLGLVGMLVGIGQLLASQERLNARIIIGRAISSAGLGASSAALLVWIPDLPLAAQLGVAALCASLGTSGLEKLFQKILKRFP